MTKYVAMQKLLCSLANYRFSVDCSGANLQCSNHDICSVGLGLYWLIPVENKQIGLYCGD